MIPFHSNHEYSGMREASQPMALARRPEAEAVHCGAFSLSAMRVISLNVNGIRSAERRGLSHWLTRGTPWDVVCLQEIKADLDDVPARMRAPRRAYSAFHPAERKGYAGVALYARRPRAVVTGFGDEEFDREVATSRPTSAARDRQRLPAVGSAGTAPAGVEVPLPRSVSCTPPDPAPARQGDHPVRDWNIAHQPIDLRIGAATRKNSGFLPEERAWLSRVFDEIGFVDVFRRIDPRPEQYTWWSNRGEAWAKNVGWRIDYQIATPGIASRAHAASIYTAKRFSDHAPLIIDYDFDIGG